MTDDDFPRVARHRVLRLLGEGGMGLVYEAEQFEPIRRRVALKVLKDGMDTKAFIGRFEAERQALAVMGHPNIAKVYEAGATENGRPYYTMEYVAGIPLTEFCDEQRLGTRARAAILMDVCAAVHHAHEKGILHRDLKPSNILVSLADDRPVPKIIDFGIAKALTGRLTDKTFATELHRPVGTMPYMSPEQWDAGALELDARADVYSLGVVLYEMLTGSLPHSSEALARAGVAAGVLIRETNPPSPSTRFISLSGQRELIAKFRSSEPRALARELRGDLDWIALKALEPDRTRRYATAQDLSLDLGRFLRHEPVRARAPGLWYRFRRFVRRHRVPVALGAAGIIAALGLTALTVAGRRSRDEGLKAMVRADLLNLVAAEERFFVDSLRYTTTISELAHLYQPSEGVTITWIEGSQTGWTAEASHATLPRYVCAILIGTRLSVEGEPICRER